MLKGKMKFVVAVVIIALTVGYLVYGGVKDTMVYYLTVQELKAQVPSVYGSRVRVSGTVVPGTIVKENDGSLEFQITDGAETIDVYYEGIIPDIFADDVEAVVEGKYAKNDVFQADTLLAKCPTKYESTDDLYENKGASY